MMRMFKAQNRRNVTALGRLKPSSVAPPPRCAKDGHTASMNVLTASPPMNVWMPKDRKSTRLNSSHGYISYAVFCLKKKKNEKKHNTTVNKKIITMRSRRIITLFNRQQYILST